VTSRLEKAALYYAAQEWEAERKNAEFSPEWPGTKRLVAAVLRGANLSLDLFLQLIDPHDDHEWIKKDDIIKAIEELKK